LLFIFLLIYFSQTLFITLERIFFAERSILAIPLFTGLFVYSQLNGGDEENRRLHTAGLGRN
jgi:hypothetical protein